MRSIMALDLSTAGIGWACGPVDRRPTIGEHKLGSFGTNIGGLVVKFDRFLNDLITLENPKIITFEAPLDPGTMSGPRRPEVARQLLALASHTEFVAETRGIPRFEEHTGTIKKFFAGTGRADKPQMVAAALARGFPARTHNEADACALWLYTVAMIDRRQKTAHAAQFDMIQKGATGGAQLDLGR